MSFHDFITNYGPTFGIAGAILIYGFGRFSASKDRKRNYRAFIKTESIDSNYNLKNFSAKEGSKLYITEHYEPIMKKLNRLRLDKNEEFIKGTYLGYMQFKNLGPGLIINATAEMHMSSKDKAWETKTTLPIMEVGEEIYVSTDNLAAFDVPYYVDEVSVVYKTQQNETIRYLYRARQDEETKEMRISESYSIKLPFINKYRNKHNSKRFTSRVDLSEKKVERLI